MDFEKDFMHKMVGRSPAVMRIRVKSDKTKNFYDKEIGFPSFYHTIAEFTGGEIYMG